MSQIDRANPMIDVGEAAALKAAVALGAAMGQNRTVEHTAGLAKPQFAVVPDGYHLTPLDAMVPSQPDRVRNTITLSDLRSFCAYVNEGKTPETRIFAQPDMKKPTFVAMIDYHAPDGQPSWCTHKAILVLTQTPEWETISAHDEKEMSQVEFAEFLEDNQIYIVEPDGATMLEIAKSLEQSSAGSFKSRVRLSDGDVALSYSTGIEARAGQDGTLTIPERIRLLLSPFEGMLAVGMEARFKTRLRPPTLTLSYVIVRKRQLILSMIEGATGMIAAETQVPIFCGNITA
jgi:uncharacterized protein YfdQ (DUF2303 family)